MLSQIVPDWLASLENEMSECVAKALSVNTAANYEGGICLHYTNGKESE